MKKVPDILTLEEIKKEDIPSVGGKGASLGEMFGIGLPVPRAFVVTAQAFRRFLGETGIEERLFAGLANLNVEDNAALEEASRKAREARPLGCHPAAPPEEDPRGLRKAREPAGGRGPLERYGGGPSGCLASRASRRPT